MTTAVAGRVRGARLGWTLLAVLAAALSIAPLAAAQTVELITQSTTVGMSASAGGATTSVSRDGRWIVFTSVSQDLVPGVTYPSLQYYPRNVYLRDRETGESRLISHAHDNPLLAANSFSDWGVISDDGNWVVFQSSATDLVPGYTTPAGITHQLYLHNRATDRTGLVSHAAGYSSQGSFGSVAPGGSCATGSLQGLGRPSISSDGSRIAFLSCALDLVPHSMPISAYQYSYAHAFVFTRTSAGDGSSPPEGTVQLVDAAAAGPHQGDPRSTGWVSHARLSGNGEWVAYLTFGSDILSGAYDANGTAGGDLFLYEVDTQQQTLVSRNWQNPGQTADQGSARGTDAREGPGISDDGQWVMFGSRASDLIQGMVNPTVDGYPALQIYLFDRLTGAMRLVTHQNGSATTGGAGYFGGDMSADGRYLALASTAKELLAPGASANNSFVVLYDRVTGLTTMVSGDSATGQDCTDSSGSGSGSPRISPDGSRVAFRSLCRQGLDAGAVYTSWPSLAKWQVYSWERASGVNTLVTRKAGGPWYSEWGGTLPTFSPATNTSGDMLAFGSVSTETTWFGDGNDDPNAPAKYTEDAFLWVLPPPPALTVTVSGSGSVTSSPAGIACPGDCSEVYALNTAVTLTAVPSPGSLFQGWSGNCNASGQVTMDAPKACTATFAPIPPADVAVSGQAAPDPVVSGGTTVVTFVVSNLGGASAASVVATFTPPPKGTVTLAPGCVKGKGRNGGITCALGTMPPGDTRSLPFSIAFRRSVSGTFATSLSAATTTPDSVPGNNTLTVQFVVQK